MRSIFDRFTEKAVPEDSGRGMPLHESRALLARDLEVLLNTRSEAARRVPAAFVECRKSSLTFGIPDFTTLSLRNPQDCEDIRRALERAIALHEKRLSRIRVTLDPQFDPQRSLRFKVEGLLSLGKERQQVQFDTELQLHTQTYAVS